MAKKSILSTLARTRDVHPLEAFVVKKAQHMFVTYAGAKSVACYVDLLTVGQLCQKTHDRNQILLIQVAIDYLQGSYLLQILLRYLMIFHKEM